MSGADQRIDRGAAAPLSQPSNESHSAVVPSGTTSQTWREHALCQGTDTEMWYPVGAPGRPRTGDRTSRKTGFSSIVPPDCKAICDACPVSMECFRYALHNEAYGVFAGTSEAERQTMRKAAGIRLHADDYGRRDPVVIERCLRMYRDEELVEDIARAIGVTPRTVHRILEAEGVELRNPDHWSRSQEAS